jgi:hypothetical protein
MQILGILALVAIGYGLFGSVRDSDEAHKQTWRELPPEERPRIYPGHFSIGEIVGCIALAVIVLVIVAMLSGGF